MLASYQAILSRSFISEQTHGNSDHVAIDGNRWVKITSKHNWVNNPNKQWISMGSGENGRENLLFNENSEKIQTLKANAVRACQGYDIPTILSMVNDMVNQLTDVPGQSRKDTERDLDSRLERLIESKSVSQATCPAITMDELIDRKILVCRHKAILVASLLAHLIEHKILPEGIVRQYRSTLLDNYGIIMGAHAWAVYREQRSNDLWIADPRWQYVNNVSKNPQAVKNRGYGQAAIKVMQERLDTLDADEVKISKPAAVFKTDDESESDNSYDEEYDPDVEKIDFRDPFRKPAIMSMPPKVQYVDVELPRAIAQPEPIIDFLKRPPITLYIEKEREKSKTTRWMRNFGKSVTTKGRHREQALNEMSGLFAMLQADPYMATVEKAKILYAYFSRVERRLGRETNHYRSILGQMCHLYKTNLSDNFSGNADFLTTQSLIDAVSPYWVDRYNAQIDNLLEIRRREEGMRPLRP